MQKERTKRCELGRRHWRDEDTSHMLAAPENARGQGWVLPYSPQRQGGPVQETDFEPLTSTAVRVHFCCLKTPSLWRNVAAAV